MNTISPRSSRSPSTARISLSVGFVAVGIAVGVGGMVGLLAGFTGGRLDMAMMRLMDVKLAFPGIMAALVIVTVLGSGLDKAMIAVGLGAMPRYARVLRGSVPATRGEPYVEAARSLGATDQPARRRPCKTCWIPARLTVDRALLSSPLV